MALLILSFLLLVAGGLITWLAGRVRRRVGLPEGRVISADMGRWRRPERPLFSGRYALTGRPDYLVSSGKDLIPVEVKSGRAPGQPYPSHLLQLGAYCLLVAETTGRRPPYGIIRYADRTFQVPYTRQLEEEVLATLDSLRSALRTGEAPRDHDNPRRCAACGFRKDCDQALV